MGEPEDQLVRRAIAGEEAALAGLLERHGPQVRSALGRAYHHRLKGQVELDDVMQVTYLEAFLRIGCFVPTGPNSFRAWLGRIAENNLRDAIRKSDANERWHAAGNPLPNGLLQDRSVGAFGEGESPGRMVGREEAQRLLEAALQQLPEDYERVLRLYDLEGRSGPEVALLIGRSHGAVKMLVARARDRLSEVMGSGSKYFSHRA